MNDCMETILHWDHDFEEFYRKGFVDESFRGTVYADSDEQAHALLLKHTRLSHEVKLTYKEKGEYRFRPKTLKVHYLSSSS